MNRSDLLRAHWDRVTAVVLLVLGVVVLVIGWFGVSDVPFASQQIPYVISAGIGGVFFLGIAGTLWLSADLQDEWRQLHLLEQAVREMPAPTGDPALDRDELLRALGERLVAGSPPARRRTRA